MFLETQKVSKEGRNANSDVKSKIPSRGIAGQPGFFPSRKCCLGAERGLRGAGLPVGSGL